MRKNLIVTTMLNVAFSHLFIMESRIIIEEMLKLKFKELVKKLDSMIKTFKNIFKLIESGKQAAEMDCSFEHIQSSKFLLKYKNEEVGELSFDGDEWTFQYLFWFKNQNELQPLFEFPDVKKVYKNKNLWPFFETRIPSEKQPKVQEYIEAHPLDKGNLAKLLAVFGNSSVNNPYKLVNI